MTSMLAAPNSRSLLQLVSLARNDSLLLETALVHLEGLSVVGITEQWSMSACLFAHKLGWVSFFSQCCTANPIEGNLDCKGLLGLTSNARTWRVDNAVLVQAEAFNRLDRVVYERGQDIFRRQVTDMAAATDLDQSRLHLYKEAQSHSGAQQSDAHRSGSTNRPTHRPISPRYWAKAPEVLDESNQALNRYHPEASLAVKPLGIVIFAAGEHEIAKAMKSAASIRRVAPTLEGSPVHITLVTDMVGIAGTQDMARAGCFDRAINAFGNTPIIQEVADNIKVLEDGKSIRASDGFPFMIIRQAKQMALRMGLALYDRAITVDADTYFCDAEALQVLAGRAKTASLVATSYARREKCLEKISEAGFADVGHELNSGVLAFQVNPKMLRFVERWNNLHHTVRCNGQDQPALHLAYVEAKASDPNFVLSVITEDMDDIYVKRPSDMPYNCRARTVDDKGNKKDGRGQCASKTYAHCSIVHGHILADANLRGYQRRPASLTTTTRDIAVFVHVPKTAGHSIKDALLPWLAKQRHDSQRKNTDYRAMGITERGLDLWTIHGRNSTVMASAVQGDKMMGSVSSIVERKKSASKYEETWAKRLSSSVVGQGSLFYGAFSYGSCSYLTRAGGGLPCAYFTMLRHPIERLISEHNYCISVDWYGDETCCGPKGADDLRERGTAVGPDSSKAEAFVEYARARGNVLVAHFALSFEAADYLYKDHPVAWHDRPKGTRITPMEARRARQGDPNTSDLLTAKFMLSHHFSVVGLTERFDESVERMAKVLGGEELPLTLLDDPKIHAHDATTIADQTGYISKEDLTDKQIAKVQAAVSLDLELYDYAQKTFDAYPLSIWPEDWPVSKTKYVSPAGVKPTKTQMKAVARKKAASGHPRKPPISVGRPKRKKGGKK